MVLGKLTNQHYVEVGNQSTNKVTTCSCGWREDSKTRNQAMAKAYLHIAEKYLPND
jgi:hypothetical protein